MPRPPAGTSFGEPHALASADFPLLVSWSAAPSGPPTGARFERVPGCLPDDLARELDVPGGR